ncbi:MAG: hypothetical protein HYY28_15610 [Betaproteobacteria bacterium]|nr:hypothetical protein [Betaproteobacteria bacterium]
MRAAIKWLGFLLIAIAVAVLPVAAWISGPWWIAAIVLGLAGGVFLLFGFTGRAPGGGDPPP